MHSGSVVELVDVVVVVVVEVSVLVVVVVMVVVDVVSVVVVLLVIVVVLDVVVVLRITGVDFDEKDFDFIFDSFCPVANSSTGIQSEMVDCDVFFVVLFFDFLLVIVLCVFIDRSNACIHVCLFKSHSFNFPPPSYLEKHPFIRFTHFSCFLFIRMRCPDFETFFFRLTCFKH